MNFLKNELGINNIQNLRRGAKGTQKLKNIGAFIGKTAGNLLLAGSLLGGLAKAGSVGASLIKEDMEVGFRRFGRTRNPLERYGTYRPSTLARPFPEHGTSLTRAVYDSTGLAPTRLKKTKTVLDLPLPAHELYSDLKVRPSSSSFESMVLGKRPQTLARMVELREEEANTMYRAKKQNKVREMLTSRRQTWETHLRSRGNIGLSGQGSFPESLLGEFINQPPPIPEHVHVPDFVASRRTMELNQLMDDYHTNLLKKDNKSRALNRFMDAVFDSDLTHRRHFGDIRYEYEYRRERNFRDPLIRQKIRVMYNESSFGCLRVVNQIGAMIVVASFVGGAIFTIVLSLKEHDDDDI
jgi:hypothetical protein